MWVKTSNMLSGRSFTLTQKKNFCKDTEQTKLISELKSLVTSIVMSTSYFELHQKNIKWVVGWIT